MSQDQPFKREQRAVAVRMLAAAGAGAGGVGLAVVLTASGSPDGLADRLHWLATAWLCLSVWLGAAIGAVARLRFFSPEDIAGSSSGPGSQAIRTANANLQNTLEQVVLAALAYAGVGLSLSRPGATLAALAALFSIGRALFWVGLSHGAPRRALGFGLTFYPSMIALAISLIAVWWRRP